MQKKREFFIMTASIGEGHSQAARAIAETIKQVHPDDAVRVLDFLSIDHVLKESYLKMIRIFPEMYDSLYSNSQNRHLGATFQSLLSWSFRKRMKRLITVLKPDALLFTHPFPACAANLLKKEADINTPLLGVITDFDIHSSGCTNIWMCTASLPRIWRVNWKPIMCREILFTPRESQFANPSMKN